MPGLGAARGAYSRGAAPTGLLGIPHKLAKFLSFTIEPPLGKRCEESAAEKTLPHGPGRVHNRGAAR